MPSKKLSRAIIEYFPGNSNQGLRKRIRNVLIRNVSITAAEAFQCIKNTIALTAKGRASLDKLAERIDNPNGGLEWDLDLGYDREYRVKIDFSVKLKNHLTLHGGNANDFLAAGLSAIGSTPGEINSGTIVKITALRPHSR